MNKIKKNIKLKFKTISILGFGIQGKAQALNLRDSGHEVIIGNINDGYRKEAIKLGFKVCSLKEAVKKSKIIFLLLPDGVHNKVLEEIIFPNCSEFSTIIFAHGYWLRFEKKNTPKNINLLMIAPRFPGRQIREYFLKGGGVPAFIDIAKDYDGDGKKIIKELCRSLGFEKAVY